MKHILPRREILRGRKIFYKLFNDGRSIKSENLILKFIIDLNDITVERKILMGFSVRKKYGCAPARNKIKRQMKECYRFSKLNLSKLNGYSISSTFIWIGKNKSEDIIPFSKINVEINECLRKLEIKLFKLSK